MSERAAAIERFRALLEEARPATGGVPLSEVASQTAAVLGLLDELPATVAETDELSSFAFRECFTALASWGRRLALLDLTPASTLQIMSLILKATGHTGRHARGDFDRQASAAAMEGFVMGREERVLELTEKRAARCLRPVPLQRGVLGLLVTGVHEPTVLSECVEALGRAMLDTGAQIGIVDFSQLGEPSAERAAAMFSAEDVTRMLGSICFFTGLDWHWKEVAERSHVPLQALRVLPTVADALRAARDPAPGPGSRIHAWQALWRRLRG